MQESGSILWRSDFPCGGPAESTAQGIVEDTAQAVLAIEAELDSMSARHREQRNSFLVSRTSRAGAELDIQMMATRRELESELQEAEAQLLTARVRVCVSPRSLQSFCAASIDLFFHCQYS